MAYNPLRELHHSDALLHQRNLARLPPSPVCPETSAPLKARGNTQGLGNRLGWYLTVSALTQSIGRRAVYTTWPNVFGTSAVGSVGQGGNRGYSFDEVNSVISWPSVLRFLEVEAANVSDAARQDFVRGDASAKLRLSSGAVLRAESVPHHPRPYVNDYVPECAWAMLSAWPRRRVSQLPACLTRTTFLQAYAQVQAELRPRVPLCNPHARSYVVLHIRRGDKLMHSRRDKGGPLTEALANATALSSVIATALRPIASATGLPFLLLTDDEDYRAGAIEMMASAGLRVIRGGGGSHGGGSGLLRPCQPQSSVSGLAQRSSSKQSSGGHAVRALADFFAILDAAGVVVIAPKGVGHGQGLQESSFASVAALTGGTPHLTPVAYALGGKMASYQERANDGQPLRGIFFLDRLEEFISKVRFHLYPSVVRHRQRRAPGRRSSAGGRV